MNIIEPKPVNSTYNDQQWQAIHQKGSNILVAASAGSGKTTVLIERILNHLLQEYAQLDELLVCTFTEAAANEMKQRMEARLKKALNQTNDKGIQQKLLQQLRLIPTAHIRTLHSFCLQVIQQYFYLVDFDPNFQLLTDETQKALLYQEVWENLVEHIFDEERDIDVTQEDFLHLLEQYTDSRSDSALFELVLELYLFACSHPESDLWLRNLDNISKHFLHFVDSSLYLKVFRPHIEQTLQAAYKIASDTIHQAEVLSHETVVKYVPFLQEERGKIARLLDLCLANDLEGLISSAKALKFDRWPTNSKKSHDYEAVNELKQGRDNAKELATSVEGFFQFNYEITCQIEEKIAPTLALIGRLTRAFRQLLSHKKAQINVIDYNDLEHLTLDILAPYNEETGKREASVAALYFQSQFKEVLVDEYQDINEIQAAILAWLAHEHRPELRGNLFMVGDVKQSIYGFRMADPSLFLAKYRAYGEHDGGELIVLDKNYRSRDEVLQFTNFVFERLMDETFGEMVYRQQESLKTGNHQFIPNAPDPRFNIECLIHVKETEENETLDETEELYIDSALEAQSYLIAEDIQRKIAQKFEVYDKELKTVRPIEYRDCVILTATRQPFLPVQQVFERYQLPVFSQKVENYFQRQEIRLMVALLKLIDNPLQDIALIAILRSYFVGLDEEALSQIRIAYPDGLFYAACMHYQNSPQKEEAIQQKLHHFFEQLEHWRSLSQRIPLVQLIWTIYQETYFLDYVAGLSNGVQRQANLHAFYQRAEEFEQSSRKGLFGFIQYIEQMMQYDNDLAEPVLLSEDENVIQMMTVHASKGLEFPVVYLLNTNKAFNLMDTHRPCIASKHYGLATDYFDTAYLLKYPSVIKKIFRLEKINQLKAEEMRKLYVALTRCEQKLIIVGSINKKEQWETLQERTRQLQSAETVVLNPQERQKAKSWLEWLIQVMAKPNVLEQSVTSFDTHQITYRWVTQEEVLQMMKTRQFHTSHKEKEEWLNRELQQRNKTASPSSEVQLIEQLMTMRYKHQLASHTSSYQSVSELKRLYEEPQNEKLSHFHDRRPLTEQETQQIQSIRYTADTFEKPNFLKAKQFDYAQIGTITHYFLQQLDFGPFYHASENESLRLLEMQLEQMLMKEKLTHDMAKVIRLQPLARFIVTEVGQLLAQHALHLKREQAFSYLLPAKWLFRQQLGELEVEQLSDDSLLIHGIVDNYIELAEGIVILDYKTDRFKPYGVGTRLEQRDAIVEKYRFQMSLYAQAVSCALNKPVQAVYLVLLDFEEVIEVTELYQFNHT